MPNNPPRAARVAWVVMYFLAAVGGVFSLFIQALESLEPWAIWVARACGSTLVVCGIGAGIAHISHQWRPEWRFANIAGASALGFIIVLLFGLEPAARWFMFASFLGSMVAGFAGRTAQIRVFVAQAVTIRTALDTLVSPKKRR